MGTIKAICTSKVRGTEKQIQVSGEFQVDFGIVGDAHGGNWHRQVSLLSAEKIQQFNQQGANVEAGAFGENVVVEGSDFSAMPVGTRLRCNEVVLEITQIGKECHSHCAIYERMGDCIMPREGVFAKVVHPGIISIGDVMAVEETPDKRPWQAAVLTLSDKGARGEREDLSGPCVVQCLEECGYEVVEQLLLPDEMTQIADTLKRLADQRQVDLILTTGGTGFGVRDCTPEATLSIATKNVPGIAEAIRAKSMEITKRAMLSRGVSVIRNKTLIVNLPGSPKACQESLEVCLDTIPHGLELLRGKTVECARK